MFLKKSSLLIYFSFFFILFFLALITRVENLFDSKELPGKQTFAFSTIGTGSDQDYQLKCASLFARGLPNEFMTHYDYLFLCPMMGIIFHYFNFIHGLIIINSIFLISGCIVCVFPYILLSSAEKPSLGGIVGSLILIFNPLMIDNSSGRFFIYPLVSFVYIIFVATLFQALSKKSWFWTTFFALIASLQSLNKPFFFVNDIPMIVVFFLLLTIKSIEFKKSPPFVQIQLEKQQIPKALFAACIYFIVTISYELINQAFTNSFSFLTDLFINTKGPSTKDAVLGASLHFKGSFNQKVKNIVALSFLSIHYIFRYLRFWELIPIAFVVNIFNRKRFFVWALCSFLGVTTLSLLLFYVRHSIFVNNTYVTVPPLNKIDFILFSVFVVIVVQLIMTSRKGLSLVGTQIFYLGALAMTLAAVIQPQLFVTVIIWVSLLISFSIKYGLEPLIKRFTNRVRLFSILLIFLIFIPSFFQTVSQVRKRLFAIQNEVRYLKWATHIISNDGYIIGGSSDNLLLISTITKKPVLINGFYVAVKVEPNNMIWENEEFSPSFPAFVKNEMEIHRQNPNLYILDHDIPRWEQYLRTGATETYPKGKYQLKLVADSPYLNRKIFVLSDNPEYTPESSSSANTKKN